MKNVILLIFMMPLTVFAQPVTEGLIGYWPLNGQTTDISQGVNNGELIGAEATSDRFGNSRRAMHFNDTYIDMGDVHDMRTGDFSISGWFRMDGSATGIQTIIAKSQLSNADSRYGLVIENSRLLVIFDYGPSIKNFRGATILENNIWYHVTVTFDRDGLASIFLNGQPEASRDISAANGVDMDATWHLTIGRYGNSGNVNEELYFHGDIDEISMYNKVLSSDEIDALFNYRGYVEQSGAICDAIYCDGESVAIGTTVIPMHYRLVVDGSAIMEEVTVQNSTAWPDYVFEADYNLRSLKEVGSYIDRNGHLPNIPSAEDIAKNGIKVGEMNAKLLEKIEELTLYTLDQQNIINSLVKRLEKLESKSK